MLTANHNLPSSSQPQVRLNGGQEVAARVLGRDPATDLALLEVDLDLPVPTWVDEGEAVGHLVFSLANPGDGVRATMGLISALGPSWRTRHGAEVERWIEVDGELPRGFSGGPLISTGGLLGLNTRGLVRGGTTLPTPTLRRLVRALQRDGRVKRPWVGIGAHAVESGLVIDHVVPGGPGQLAGLRAGDVVVAVDGAPFEGFGGLQAALRSKVDQDISLTIRREGEEKVLSLTVEERPARSRGPRGRCGHRGWRWGS